MIRITLLTLAFLINQNTALTNGACIDDATKRKYIPTYGDILKTHIIECFEGDNITKIAEQSLGEHKFLKKKKFKIYK
ncbi:MAG: hypothetical protein HOE90_03895 [Bacteriovoracaceae bacterium]|nr:hypothetical protein [Bacteriovoracaceae bacterium]